jgi:hypothetical protein
MKQLNCTPVKFCFSCQLYSINNNNFENIANLQAWPEFASAAGGAEQLGGRQGDVGRAQDPGDPADAEGRDAARNALGVHEHHGRTGVGVRVVVAAAHAAPPVAAAAGRAARQLAAAQPTPVRDVQPRDGQADGEGDAAGRRGERLHAHGGRHPEQTKGGGRRHVLHRLQR